jgi:hypothetical protein
MSIERFKQWIENSEPGDNILYLQSDHASKSPAIQKLFWQAAIDGKVFLYQKRVRPGIFNYFAKKVTPRTGKVIKPFDYGD